MPDLAVAGPLSVAIDALRTLIANMSFFQTWTTSADAAAALARIFTGELGLPIDTLTISGGVVTVTTREPHNLSASAAIELEGSGLGAQALGLAGPQTIATVPSATTFTFATTLSDGEFNPEGAVVLPCARPFVCLCEEEGSLRVTSIANACPVYSGAVEILLDANISSGYREDPRNAGYEMRNAFGQFVEGLGELSGSGDFMLINEIDTVSPPRYIDRIGQSDNSKRYERWQALIRVTWGLGA